jgi:diguanylate cyclase (GGDEF)-like protein
MGPGDVGDGSDVANEIQRSAILASLKAVTTNAAAGSVGGPLTGGLILLNAGSDRMLIVVWALVLAMVTFGLLIAARRSQRCEAAGLLRSMRWVELTLIATGVATGAIAWVPMPGDATNLMFPVMLAYCISIVSVNMPSGYARTRYFISIAGPIVLLSAASALRMGGFIGPTVAGGILTMAVLIGVNGHQAGAAFREATRLRVRNAVLVNDLEQANAELDRRAQTDVLTGTANRSGLMRSMHERRSNFTRCAILYIDLDGFKMVNDSYGHDAGDAVLATVADRLVALLRSDDVVARLGGDEFVVLAELVSERAMDELVARIRVSVEAPIEINRSIVQVGASIGASFVVDPDQLDHAIETADAAMYTQKRQRSHHQLAAVPMQT